MHRMPRKGHNDYNTRRCGSSFLRQTLPGRDKDSAYDKTQLGSSELVFMKNIVEEVEAVFCDQHYPAQRIVLTIRF